MLGLWIQQREGAKSWPQVLKQLRQRGVKDVLIAVTDALTGFAPAIGAAFPKAQVQTCIVHWLRNSFAQVSCRERKALSTTLQCIYLAPGDPGAAAALRALQVFEGTELGRKCPGIARSWHAHWEQVTPCFSFTQTIRQSIYTTHAIERLNSCVRRAVATRAATSPATARPPSCSTRRCARWSASGSGRPPSGSQPAAS